MKSKLEKSLMYAVISVLVLSNIPNNVYAVSPVIDSNIVDIKPYAEEVKWYYRDINGRQQKRLWSRTYGHWITDWIWV